MYIIILLYILCMYYNYVAVRNAFFLLDSLKIQWNTRFAGFYGFCSEQSAFFHPEKNCSVGRVHWIFSFYWIITEHLDFSGPPSSTGWCFMHLFFYSSGFQSCHFHIDTGDNPVDLFWVGSRIKFCWILDHDRHTRGFFIHKIYSFTYSFRSPSQHFRLCIFAIQLNTERLSGLVSPRLVLPLEDQDLEVRFVGPS